MLAGSTWSCAVPERFNVHREAAQTYLHTQRLQSFACLQFVLAPSSAALLHADHRSLDLTPTNQFMQVSAEFAFVT